MLKGLSFSVKLFAGTLSLIIITILIMGGINYFTIKEAAEDMGFSMVEGVGNQLLDTVRMQESITQEKVNSDLTLMDMEIAGIGSMALDSAQPVTMKITNQVTKQSETVTIPALTIGGRMVNNNFELVDQVQRMVGGTATIFQVLPGKMLRVSTNVKKLDGNRATGTYIPDFSPVYKTCLSGETFRGKAYVVNAWYATAYKPVRDPGGKIVAVIYVGRKIMTDQLAEVLQHVTVGGAGYAFVFNSKGEFLYHPNKAVSETNILDYPFGKLLMDKKQGLVQYDYQGEKVSYLEYFEPWDWHIGIGISKKEMLHGMDTSILKNTLISGAIALLLGIIVSLLLNRMLVTPLKAAVAVTELVGHGDLTARMDVKSTDEIGRLGNTFNQVMDQIEAAMDKNEGFVTMLNTVPAPIFVVDDKYKIILGNLATARAAGTSQDGLAGVNCREVFISDIWDSPDCPVNKARETKGQFQSEVTEMTVSGKQIFTQPISDIIRDKDGNLVGYLVMARNVTESVLKEREVQKNLEHIENVNREVGEAADQIANAVDEITVQVDEARNGADLQSDRTASVATSMEEMNSTVLEVARNASDAANNADDASGKAREGADVVNKAVTSIQNVQSQVLDLQQKMLGLGEQAENIGQIIHVINDIADQTNLLALNAAIEAARAGDAGRGFAVVADEVRKLAEKTMGATKEVENAVADIQRGTKENIDATENAAKDITESTEMANASGECLAEILALVETTTDQVRNIATASEEQSAASEEITHSVDEINRVSAETAEGTARSAEAVSRLGELARRLRDLSQG